MDLSESGRRDADPATDPSVCSVSVLYASSAAQRRLSSIAHFFIPSESMPYKLQPGGPGYELAASTPAVFDYLLSLAPDSTFETAFRRIAAQEQSLMEPLLACLKGWKARGVSIVGPESHEAGLRAPTVSFVVVEADARAPGKLRAKLKSEEIVKHFDAKGDMSVPILSLFLRRVTDRREGTVGAGSDTSTQPGWSETSSGSTSPTAW